ncbi:hypothetical protein AAG906_006094 [Vitis piasezkii]
MDLHCAYHQGLGHETDRCTALRHAIQDLIDQGLVHLGQPSVTTNPLPAHTTHVVPPLTDSMHSIDFAELDDHIQSWDESGAEPIVSDEIREIGRTPHVDDVHVSEVQYVIRRGRMSTKACISIWSLLASASTHRDALTWALSQIRVETTTTPEGLIHMMTAGRATCIVFSDDDLPPKGLDHTCPLYISIGCSSRRVPSVLLDNGSALNICHLATNIAIGYAPSNLCLSTQTVRAYDNTRREIMGTLEIELLIGLTTFVTLFQVVTVQSARDMFIAVELVLQISHGDDDLLFMGFTFDEVNMSYIPGMGLGRCQHGPSEFMTIPDHDVSFGLGLSQIEDVVQLGLTSSFDLFGVSTIEIVDDIPTSLAPEFVKDDILALDPSIIQHRFPLLPHARPVKQKLRRLHPCWSLQFFRYNHILMALKDMEKTSFITEWGTYCYRVMPFRLKNVGATYQRAVTTLFHDMMYRDVEVYVDDMIVKSRDRSDHLATLKRFFEMIRQFSLRLNPKKCTFGVISRKLLGYMVNERGIEVDLDKIRAILDMPALRTERERIREYLLLPPVLALHTPGRHLLLCLSISNVPLGCMLAQLDDSGKDRAIYYLSKRMLNYKMRYAMIERYCLALVWATRRLRNYMTEYSVHLISCLDPLRYLFDRPALVGRLMRWLVLLIEFDIHYVTQKSIRGSIVIDHLASLPFSDGKAIDDDFPDEDVAAVTSLSGWHMYFNGVANHSRYKIGVLLISPHGDHIPRSVHLAFSDQHPTTNNIVKYEACILGLETALELRIRQMKVLGDFNLVLRQIQGKWKTRDNQFADTLATLASMIDVPTDAIVRPLLIESRFDPAYCCLIDDTEPNGGLPWYHDIYHFLRLGVYPEAATAKDKRALR